MATGTGRSNAGDVLWRRQRCGRRRIRFRRVGAGRRRRARCAKTLLRSVLFADMLGVSSLGGGSVDVLVGRVLARMDKTGVAAGRIHGGRVGQRMALETCERTFDRAGGDGVGAVVLAVPLWRSRRLERGPCGDAPTLL